MCGSKSFFQLYSKDYPASDFRISSFNNQAPLCVSYFFLFLFLIFFFLCFGISEDGLGSVVREAPKAAREFPLVRRRPPYPREIGDLRACITYNWSWPPSEISSLLLKYLYQDMAHAIINLSHIINLTSTREQDTIHQITTLPITTLQPNHIKMPSSTMTLSPQPISIQPITVPSSDVDFGAVIENVDLENLTGK